MALPSIGYARELLGSIAKRGLKSTVSLLLPEVLFDLRHGTDTFALVSNEALHDVPSASKAHGGSYQGANPKLFFDVFRQVGRDVLPGFGDQGFIDYGCGKGRALIMAAELGFRRAVGVEHSGRLCETARRNAATFRGRSRRSCDIEVVHGDARAYAVPADLTVFFFFNPFGPAVLEPVLGSIAASLSAAPRPGFAIYLNPQHPEVFEAAGFTPLLSWGSDHVTPDAVLYKGPAGRVRG